MLVIQGSRDTFGTPEELRPAFEPLSPPAAIHVIEGGDHSFKVAGANAQRRAAVDEEVTRTATEWMLGVMRASGSTPTRHD